MNVLESQSEPSIAGENAKAATNSYEDGRPKADHSKPANKIPFEIRKGILEICNRPEYASMALCEIVPALAMDAMHQSSCLPLMILLGTK